MWQRRIRATRHPRQRNRSWPCRPQAAMKLCRRGSPRPKNSLAGRATTCDTLGELVMPLSSSVFTIFRSSSTRKPLTTCRKAPSIYRDLQVNKRPRQARYDSSLFLLNLTDLRHHLRRSKSWIACHQERSATKYSRSTSNRFVCTSFIFSYSQGLLLESHAGLPDSNTAC